MSCGIILGNIVTTKEGPIPRWTYLSDKNDRPLESATVIRIGTSSFFGLFNDESVRDV
jgi:hypothetical protein